MRSRNDSPRFRYFLAIETTSRRFPRRDPALPFDTEQRSVGSVSYVDANSEVFPGRLSKWFDILRQFLSVPKEEALLFMSIDLVLEFTNSLGEFFEHRNHRLDTLSAGRVLQSDARNAAAACRVGPMLLAVLPCAFSRVRCESQPCSV